MAKLVQITPDPTQGSRLYLAVDDEGNVWRGEMKWTKDQRELYFAWTRIRSEFDERSLTSR